MSTSRPFTLAALAAVGPLFIIVACGGGTPDAKTPSGDGAGTTTAAATTTDPTSTAVASASASSDDNDEDDSIPTSDVICKHLADVLKGKAGSLKACIAELEKKQDDDANYFVCFAGCAMPATTGDAIDACKAKCKK